MTRAELQNKLRQATHKVTFIKKDGTRRVMVCTLRNDIVKSYGSGTFRKEPENLLTVWDCDTQGWRRINLDTLERCERLADFEAA